MNTNIILILLGAVMIALVGPRWLVRPSITPLALSGTGAILVVWGAVALVMP